MIIKEILRELETKTYPVAKAIHSGSNFKALVVAFKKGMILKEHKTSMTTKLTVLEGCVSYHNGQTHTILKQYDEFLIPLKELHSVTAIEDALCLLTQG